jgi:hypothetical protein
MESEKELELEKYFPNKGHIRNADVLQRVDFFKSLSESANFQEVCGKLPYDWRRHGDMFNRIFIDVVQYDFFIDFCVFDEPSPEVQKELGPEMKSTGEAIYFIDDLNDEYFQNIYSERNLYLSK